jgi:hypothetical protein
MTAITNLFVLEFIQVVDTPPRMGGKRNAYRLLVAKPEGKKPLGRPRRRWLNNVRIDLLELR